MLSLEAAKQLQIVAEIPAQIQSPSFYSEKSLWVKQDYHPLFKSHQIPAKKYSYTKNGKIFSFERTRYITCYQDHFFYYQDQTDTTYKGFCCFRNVYFSFYLLKSKRYLLHLSNGSEESFFYFQNDEFYKSIEKVLLKHAISLNFNDKYSVQQNIGQGSFSQVYMINDRHTKQIFAAKVVSKKDKNKSPTKTLVEQQKKILSAINSEYVYQYYAFYQDQDSYIFILEYLSGKDLMTLFKEQTEFSLNDIIYIFKGVLKGIEDCHKVKVIHRDLKPQNIIINLSTLKPKIIDFGLSLLYNSTTQNKHYKRCGTMGYMAPQVIINTADVRRPYPDKCDLFSFGIIAHMILLGRNPLKGKSYQQTYSKNKLCEIHLQTEQINKKYGQSCYKFLQNLLQKNHKKRYSASQALQSPFLLQKKQGKYQGKYKQQSAQTASQEIKPKNLKEAIITE